MRTPWPSGRGVRSNDLRRPRPVPMLPPPAGPLVTPRRHNPPSGGRAGDGRRNPAPNQPGGAPSQTFLGGVAVLGRLAAGLAIATVGATTRRRLREGCAVD